MSLYFYARPSQYSNGSFDEQVAVAEASSKRDALDKLSEYFFDADIKYVHHVRFGYSGVCVLTDF